MAAAYGVIPDLDDPNIFHLNAGPGDEHPERAGDETFLRYMNGAGFSGFSFYYDTLRAGTRVIDDHERDRTTDADGAFFPVFVKTREFKRKQITSLAEEEPWN